MSTRGIYGVKKDGVLKCTYNHFDSYPKGLGKKFLSFIACVGIVGLTKWYQNIFLVPDTEENYEKLAVYQGNFDIYEQELDKPIQMIDNSKYMENNLAGCDYAYIANLDTGNFEFYSADVDGIKATIPLTLITNDNFRYIVDILTNIPAFMNPSFKK